LSRKADGDENSIIGTEQGEESEDLAESKNKDLGGAVGDPHSKG